jgi:hypothetical protein
MSRVSPAALVSAVSRLIVVVAAAGLARCADNGVTPNAPTPPPVGTDAPAGNAGGNPLLRLRCEARTGRSKVSVDGDNLVPGSYRASVRSGGNTITSNPMTTRGNEVEFDFDSNPGDIAAGAVRIPPDFIQGGRVEAILVTTSGMAIANTVSACSWQ